MSNLNVFEFTSYPYMDAQQQVQGLYVNMCMRLVHYVLIQGLGLTNDWDRTAHDDSSFVSCTHLRNISHMTDTRHFRRAPSRGWIPACCTWIWEWQRCELSLQERVGVRDG